MTEAVEQLKSQVSSLSTAERADLAHFLLTSLEFEKGEVEAAWREEIARRIADIRSGKAIGRPVGEILAELRGQSATEAEFSQENCLPLQFFSSQQYLCCLEPLSNLVMAGLAGRRLRTSTRRRT